jgi:thiamine pyrophosphate-dependent acetolactate synthase large subunit-like protein
MLCGVQMNALKQMSRYVMKSSNSAKPTIGNYIITSLLDKNIEVAFGYNKLGPYSPIYKYVKENEDFNIVFEKYEKNCGFNALKYSANTNNMGVIVSTSTIGFGNLMTPIGIAKLEKRPLLLLSFFNPENELKVRPFPSSTKHYIKESITLKTAKNFSADMEALLSYGYEFPAGPVHLNVSNNIIDSPIEFGVKKDWSNEPQPIFQKSLPVKTPVIQPNVVFARQLCEMHIDNALKKRNSITYSELLDIH